MIYSFVLTKFLDCGGEQKRVDQKLKHLGEVEQVKQKTKALQEKVPLILEENVNRLLYSIFCHCPIPKILK